MFSPNVQPQKFHPTLPLSNHPRLVLVVDSTFHSSTPLPNEHGPPAMDPPNIPVVHRFGTAPGAQASRR